MPFSRLLFTLTLIAAAMAPAAAQISSTAPCDAIAARLRGNPGDDPSRVLTQGDGPVVELAADSELRALGLKDADNETELITRFIAAFNPSDDLRRSWVSNVAMGHVDVAKLNGSSLHVITMTGGSALCTSFTFFTAVPGRPAQLLPALPRKSDRDGENLICEKYGGGGYLARIESVEAFLEMQGHDRTYSYRVVPLRNGKWSDACAAEAQYETLYSTSKAFVPGDSPFTERELRILAGDIVKRRDAVESADDFAYGPPLTESEKEDFRAMTALISTPEPFPAFGRETELGAGEETLRSGESLPIVVNGKTYLLRIGTGQLGCCYFPGPLLIVYALKDGKLNPVGAAVVEKSRGRLQSVHSSASR